jgi:plasmid stability protein
MHYYTYAYLREDKTPYYIGKGKEDRIYSKQKNIKPPKDKSRIIFLKQNLTEEEAFKHEKYMIAVFGRKDLGTGILHNRTDGGEGVSGGIHSPETKEKMSAAQKGEKNHNYGKTLSPETRAKISAATKGKTCSPETKEKMSAAQKGENHPFYGKTLSLETRAKMSAALKGENNPRYGKSHTPEARAKISAARKGKNNPMYGKKWWNDGCGNCKIMIECPGDGWKPGRK